MPSTSHMQSCRHAGQVVKIGNYQLRAGALADVTPESFRNTDILVVLCEIVPAKIWSMGFKGTHIWSYPVKDYEGATGPWKKFLLEVAASLKEKKCIFVCCQEGHGRTGMFLASLTALLEEPLDPIATVRERYCPRAVEIAEQAEEIFALMGKSVPPQYAMMPKSQEDGHLLP